MNGHRAPAVAGLFYPDDPGRLHSLLAGWLEGPEKGAGATPKALIAPHAGYIYSGPVAATAYRHLIPGRECIRRVVLLGPAHRLPFRGLALPSVSAFETPLGVVPLDRRAVRRIATLPQVVVRDDAHAGEHSLEVHLPFLQEALESFTLVPLTVGAATPEEVAEVLDELWGGEETVIVVSSDLSHYEDYDTARELDEHTARLVEALRFEELRRQDACGCDPIRGLLLAARRRGLSVETVDLRNSGDTAGPRHEVVGYGAFLLWE